MVVVHGGGDFGRAGGRAVRVIIIILTFILVHDNDDGNDHDHDIDDSMRCCC